MKSIYKFKYISLLLVLFVALCGYAQCNITVNGPGQNGTYQFIGDSNGTLNISYTRTNCSSSSLTFSSLPDWITSVTDTGTHISINYLANPEYTNRLWGIYVYYQGNTVELLALEQCNELWYLDTDGDGYGDANGPAVSGSCSDPFGGGLGVQNNLDYCDNDANSICPELNPNPDPNRNWITSKTYDINGTLKSSSKAYFDDLGKPIQTQTLDVKNNRTWATGTLHDSQGRPALNSLSAPIDENNGAFTYKHQFIQDEGNNTYLSSDFENDPENPSKVGTQPSTLGHYYSTNNVDDPSATSGDSRYKGNDYQDVTSYPFSRTIYSDLNPGAALKVIGGNKTDTDNDGDVDDNDTWIQSYTFSMPAGDELSFEGAFNDASYKTSDGSRKIIKTVSRDVHGNEVVAFSDTDGKALAVARVGGAVTRNTTVTIGEQGFVDVHVPDGTTGFTINGQSGITTEVYDLITEQIVAGATTGLPKGFYRISITNLESYNPDTNPVTITYTENYYDYSLNEYDEAGRLIASYQPLQHLKSEFEYNALGQLTYTKSPDEGEAWFLYREDEQIRFSQNSKQTIAGEFSYTNYDDLGRPAESGVAVGTFSGLNPDLATFSFSSKSEQQFTTYDELENTDITLLSGVPGDYDTPTFLASNVAKTHNDNTTTYYSYDVYGRVKWVVQDIAGLGIKTIDYKYDQITGAVLEIDYQKNVTDERFIHRYTYDTQDDSLVKVETSTTGNTNDFTTQAEYKYYETGALKRVELAPHPSTGTPLQGLDYVYNLNGQLKAINHPSLTAANDPGGDSNDLFGMHIDYHENDYARLSGINAPNYGKAQYNGNIKGIRWNNKQLENTARTYSYYYNKNNWLENAIYGQYNDESGDGSTPSIIDSEVHEDTDKAFKATKSITFRPGFHAKPGTGDEVTANIVTGVASKFQKEEYNVFDITYDPNGNIRTLNRNKNGTAGTNAMDKLNYNYYTDKPNQLAKVEDFEGEKLAGKDIGNQTATENYIYNEIGQLIENKEENITYIYNTSGLVTEVKKDNYTRVKFFYNDKGHRVKKEAYIAGTPTLDYTEHYVRDAAGTALVIYRNGNPEEYTIYGVSRLGVYKPNTGSSGGNSVYQITDHLGNVRAVAQWNGTNAEAIVATDYYPFGMPMPNRDDGAGVNGYRYKYQGQEVDPETGKEAFELRLWDSRIGRWLTTDPYGQHSSPYLGMGNNPTSRIDQDGGIDEPIKFTLDDNESSSFEPLNSFKNTDWYEKLDENGNPTGVFAWFDGDYDIQGYRHLGYNTTVNSRDINGNRTLIKFDGDTKSSYLYNSETAEYDFLNNYNYIDSSALVIPMLYDWYNSGKIVGDQFGGAFINGFQGVGILIYEGIANGRDLGGYNAADLGYEPLIDMETTTLSNNGQSIIVNLHGNGTEAFIKTYTRSLLRLLPFQANLSKNPIVDKIISSQMRSRARKVLE